MNTTQKVAAGVVSAFLAAGGITAGVLIPGSDGDPDRIVGHTADVSYEIFIQEPLEVYLFPESDPDAVPSKRLVELPIGTDEPMMPGSEFYLPVWARNEGTGELRGVNAYVIPALNETGSPAGCGFCGDIIEMQGEMVNLLPDEEEMYALYIKVGYPAQVGSRNIQIIFDYIASLENTT